MAGPLQQRHMLPLLPPSRIVAGRGLCQAGEDCAAALVALQHGLKGLTNGQGRGACTSDRILGQL